MRHATFLGLAGCLVVAFAETAVAHPGHLYTAFHATSLDQAFELAEPEGKLVFVYVNGPDGRGCPYLRWTNSRNERVNDLLLRETVVVELNTNDDAELLAGYGVKNGPVILLLNADGSERRRLQGDILADKLVHELRKDLEGREALGRVEAALGQLGSEHFLTRERLARGLVSIGSIDKAIKEYTWCMQVCMAGEDLAAVTRRGQVFRGFAEFAQQNPDARKALDSQRAKVESVLLNTRDDSLMALDLAAMNRLLGEEKRTMDLFDKLASDSRARHGLFDSVFDQLVEQKRYEEVLSLVQPVKAFKGEVDRVRYRSVKRAAPVLSGGARGTRGFALARGAGLLEALSGLNKTKEARELVDEIVAYDNSPEVRTMLSNRAQRGGNNVVVQYVTLKSKSDAVDSE